MKRRVRFRAALAAIAASLAACALPASAGAITDYPLPTADAGLTSKLQGPYFGNGGIVSWQGDLWFAMEKANRLGRITMDGQISELAIPEEVSEPNSGPFASPRARTSSSGPWPRAARSKG
ncbi:MAG: hypothetical protein GEU88_13630 [Solirubrobacterales bacterium]|nr:hypothetical protein [Solirubrobacterales bacterium]